MDVGTQRASRRAVLLGIGAGLATMGMARHAEASALGQFSPSGKGEFDHSVLDDLLRRFVKPDADRYHRVDYQAFQRSGAETLKAYITRLAELDPSRLSRNEAHAYWINLYNAKTLDVVLEHYPVGSIKEINLGGGILKRGPWSRNILTVNGVALSLDDIEHRIVRPVFADPMSHYGLNCASYSCPNLAVQAYTGKTIDGALAQSARDYINHRRGLHVSNGRITASKIYSWYVDDFGGTGHLKQHWKRFAAPELASDLDHASINGYDYDWSLNDL